MNITNAWSVIGSDELFETGEAPRGSNRAMRRHPITKPRKVVYKDDPAKRLAAKRARLARRVQRAT